MNYNDMSAAQCADWLAEKDGWNAFARHPDGSITAWINERYASCGVVLTHPMPLTLDAAAGALREPWRWDRVDWMTASVETTITQFVNLSRSSHINTEGPDELTARYRAAVAARMEEDNEQSR
jgi:hypothetical protein